MNWTAIAITAIVCTTLVVISLTTKNGHNGSDDYKFK